MPAHWPGAIDYGATGVYSIDLTTGTMAAGLAAGAEICQFRWTSTTKKALIKEVTVSAGGITAFTAGFTKLDLIVARAFTAAGTGGGTATLTTNNAKLRTDFQITGLGEARIATTAALGAGTKTLDAQSLAGVVSSTTATAGAPICPPTTLFKASDTDQGIVLEANEGIVIRATVPAGGTWTGTVTIKWTELADF